MSRAVRHSVRSTLLLLLSLSLVLISVTPLGAQSSTDVAVVVHSGVQVDNLTLSDVRHLLLGDRAFWPASLRVTLILLGPGAPERAVILKTVCQMTEADFERHWIAKVFRADTAVRPRIASSNEMSVELASQTPGAIAFIDASKVGGNLKVVKIDGKAPGQRGYALH